MSDEHVAYLEWHDEMVPKMGGNEWAAWAKPSAARKRLINGILKVKTPLIFTFRAREKTQQKKNDKGKNEIVNIGWQPVAPIEIVHTLDLTCILPPRADGVPVWKSDKIGEDFIIKLPNYLKPYIEEGRALSEAMGRGFATWAKGGQPSSQTARQTAGEVGATTAQAPTDLPGNLPEPESPVEATERLEKIAREEGTDGLRSAWEALPGNLRKTLGRATLDRLKEIAEGTSP